MTPQAKRQVKVGVVTTVLAGVLLFLLGVAENQVVTRGEYELRVRHFEEADRSLARDIGDVMDISLEVLCEVKPTSQKCRR